MKNLRIAFLYSYKLVKRYGNIFLPAILVILLLIIYFWRFNTQQFKPTISEGLVGTYTENDLPTIVTNLLSQGLVGIDQSGQPKLNLVTGWEINNDASNYTFHLKKGLRWSDGSTVRAEDIAISVPEAQITTPDDETIQIKLSDSFSPLPVLLDKPIFKKESEIGVGPYKIDRLDTTPVFVRRVKLQSLRSDLPNVVISFYPNEKTAQQALRIGEIQSILGVNKPDEFANDQPFEIISHVNTSRIVSIFYNTKDSILSDKNFRLALSFAAPSIPNQEEAITSLPKTSWAFNPNVKDYLDNPEQAKLSMSKIKNGLDSTIVLTSTTQLEEDGKKIVEGWNKLGFKTSLKVESGIPQNFQALLISQDIPLDPDQYSLWHSTQPQTNTSKYSSPRVDKDLEDGRKTANLEERKAKYQDFQKVLLDDAPATFLYFPKYNVVAMRKIDKKLRDVLTLQLPLLRF